MNPKLLLSSIAPSTIVIWRRRAFSHSSGDFSGHGVEPSAAMARIT
jgi:hypothetical protein